MTEQKIIEIVFRVADAEPDRIMAVLGHDCIFELGLDFVMTIAQDAARTTRRVPHMTSREGRPEVGFDGEVHDEAISIILDRLMDQGCAVRFDNSALPEHFRR